MSEIQWLWCQRCKGQVSPVWGGEGEFVCEYYVADSFVEGLIDQEVYHVMQ